MKRAFSLLALILVLPFVAFSQSAVPDSVYRQADDLVSRQAVPELNAFLSKSTSSSWYPRLETYLLKKSRQMVIENKLDEAKVVSLAVIDANLDNKEAVDLYQSIQVAITKRDADAKKVAEEQSLTTYKQKAAESKIKQELPKTYKTATNTATGKKVYLDQDFNSHYRKLNWDFMLGLANLNAVYSPEDLSLKYGVSASGSLFYIGETFTVGADIIGDAMILTFTGPQAINWTAGAVASLGVNSVSKYMVLRTGFSGLGFGYGSDDIESSLFLTPVVGLGLRDVAIRDSGRFAFALDWYPGHLMEDDMTVALGANMLLTFILADMQDFDIHFQAGVRDTVLLYSDGLKNDAKLLLAIGVGNYE